jgi:hypothetical protein
MCRGHSRSLWKPRTCTPRQTRVRKPWLTPRHTARTYAGSGSTSHRPRRCTPDATLSLMLVMWQEVRGRTPVKSSRPSSWTPMAPSSSHGPGRTPPPQRCSYATYPSLQTLNCRSSTATFGHWWSAPPYSRQKAPHHATSTWPSAQSEGWARSSQTPRSTSGKGFYPRQVATPQLHRTTKQHPPHNAPKYATDSGLTTTHAASSTRGNWPAVALLLIGLPWTWLRLTILRGSMRRPPQVRWPTVQLGQRLEPQSKWPGPTSLQTPHLESAIPAALRTTHQHHQVHRGNEPCCMAGRFSARLPSQRGG